LFFSEWSADALLALRLLFAPGVLLLCVPIHVDAYIGVRLLCVPVPRQEIQGGEPKMICVSGYMGTWRTSLKELIVRTGAKQVR